MKKPLKKIKNISTCVSNFFFFFFLIFQVPKKCLMCSNFSPKDCSFQLCAKHCTQDIRPCESSKHIKSSEIVFKTCMWELENIWKQLSKVSNIIREQIPLPLVIRIQSKMEVFQLTIVISFNFKSVKWRRPYSICFMFCIYRFVWQFYRSCCITTNIFQTR
jgi:hypothetical protein